MSEIEMSDQGHTSESSGDDCFFRGAVSSITTTITTTRRRLEKKRTRRGKKRRFWFPENRHHTQHAEQVVINISDHTLTKHQEKVLSKGLGYVPSNKVNAFNLKVDCYRSSIDSDSGPLLRQCQVGPLINLKRSPNLFPLRHRTRHWPLSVKLLKEI